MEAGERNSIIMFALLALAGAGWAGYQMFKPTPQERLISACADIVSERIPTPASFSLQSGYADLRTGVVDIAYDRQNLMGAVIRVPAECRFRPADDGPLQLDGLRVEAREVEEVLVDAWNLRNRVSGDWTWPETP
ncbi:hypothetical protein [Algihabitans albus]|uniref:hypothetical protein n=1 Tax=Algihabitans albus TaxID=2164067 RepID=UPI000E5CED1E|nr:hypothetical protein [Algihabitans albus]